MQDLQTLKNKLTKALSIKSPSLAVKIEIHNLQNIISKMESKMKNNGNN